MHTSFYQPAQIVTGPAYSAWFKLLATLATLVLFGLGLSVMLQFPVLGDGWSMQLLIIATVLMLGWSYYVFLHATTTINHLGITQTSIINRQVIWQDVRSAKMIGLPFAGQIFPPRLLVRTGNAYVTFNGGTTDLLKEFAAISLAFQMKK